MVGLLGQSAIQQSVDLDLRAFAPLGFYGKLRAADRVGRHEFDVRLTPIRLVFQLQREASPEQKCCHPDLVHRAVKALRAPDAVQQQALYVHGMLQRVQIVSEPQVGRHGASRWHAN